MELMDDKIMKWNWNIYIYIFFFSLNFLEVHIYIYKVMTWKKKRKKKEEDYMRFICSKNLDFTSILLKEWVFLSLLRGRLKRKWNEMKYKFSSNHFIRSQNFQT